MKRRMMKVRRDGISDEEVAMLLTLRVLKVLEEPKERRGGEPLVGNCNEGVTQKRRRNQIKVKVIKSMMR